GFSGHVLSGFERDQRLTSVCVDCNDAETVVCSKANFASVGGFDETIVDPGRAHADLRAVLLRADVKARSFCGNLPARIGRDEIGASEAERIEPIERDLLAVVAFRETMGYTIARLTLGTSSHNNDLRPFDA